MEDERDRLVARMRKLVEINRIKQKIYQKENNLGPEVGFLTREDCEMACLYIKMQSLGVTFNDCLQERIHEDSTRMP